MRKHLAAVLSMGVIATALLAPATAEARLSQEYTYSYEQTWRAAIRMVAVDLRYRITDRDEEIGYLLFNYTDHGRDYHGSIELVRATGRYETPIVRVVIQVPQMPSYVERMMLDRLARKMMSDYGQPPPTRRAPEPAPPPDVEEPPSEEAPDEVPDQS